MLAIAVIESPLPVRMELKNASSTSSHYQHKDDLRPHLLDYSYVRWVVVKPPPDNITSCIMHGCGALSTTIHLVASISGT